jgi:hypothetical protein
MTKAETGHHHDVVLGLVFLWALFFGSLGVMVLYVIRHLVGVVWQRLSTTTMHTHILLVTLLVAESVTARSRP